MPAAGEIGGSWTVTTLCRLHAAQKCQFGAATIVIQGTGTAAPNEAYLPLARASADHTA
jgi:hypothetical protein